MFAHPSKEVGMARKPIIGALLLVAVGVVLGTTVFRDDIAQATGLAPAPSSVVVVNTAAQAVPTREQNLDSAGNINVAVAPSYIVKSGGGSLTCTTNDSPCPVVTGGVIA